MSIWFRVNRFSLVFVKKKTKCIVFDPFQKRNIQLLIDDPKIDQVKETVFLGVIMDENLNWKSEIPHVTNQKKFLNLEE